MTIRIQIRPDAAPQKGAQWRCPCGEYNFGTRCGACHHPNYESAPQKETKMADKMPPLPTEAERFAARFKLRIIQRADRACNSQWTRE